MLWAVINKSLFLYVYQLAVQVTSQDKSPHRDRHKMFAFSPLLFSQSILCWQVRRKMSNKCKECVCEFPPPRLLSINSCIPISAKSAQNSLVFTFKAVLSVNSVEPAKQSLRHLLRICRGAAVGTESDDRKPNKGGRLSRWRLKPGLDYQRQKELRKVGGRQRNGARKWRCEKQINQETKSCVCS